MAAALPYPARQHSEHLSRAFIAELQRVDLSQIPDAVNTNRFAKISERPSWIRLAPLLVVAISALGGLLRFLQIGNKGLWLDEAFSVWMGWQPLSELFAWLLRVDQHPPLYYTALHFWMGLGDSASVVRAFSALMSTLTIPLIYLVGRRLGSAKVGLAAAVILAVSPFHVRFAQETRMYALLTFNATAAMLALAHLLTDSRSATMPLGQQLGQFYRTWRAAQKAERAASSAGAPSSVAQQDSGPSYGRDFREAGRWVAAPTQRRWLPVSAISTDLAWLGYIVFTAATVLTHNTAIFFPIAANIFVFGLLLIRRKSAGRTQSTAQIDGSAPTGDVQPPSLPNWLWAQFGAFLLWSPWLMAFVIQATGVYREFWIPKPTLQTVWATITTFWSAFLPPQITWSPVIWALFALLMLFGVVRLRQRPATLALLVILWTTPFLGELVVSLRRPIFYDRTLIWASIPVYLLLAHGIVQLRFRPYVLAALAMLVTVNGLSLNQYYNHFEKEQWREAAAYVAQNAQNEDMILFNATWVQIPFDFYFRYANRPIPEHGAPVDLFDRGVLEPKMTVDDLPRLHALIRDHPRIWLVYSHDWYTDPDKLIPSALDEELDLLETRRFFGLQVQLYGVP